MANGHGGKRTGAGRRKGTLAKKSVRRELLLLEAKAQFEAYEYDPLQELILIAQQDIITDEDMRHVEMHKLLARKYYPDVAAVKVSGDADAPLQFQVVRTSYSAWLASQEHASNGHGVTDPSAV